MLDNQHFLFCSSINFICPVLKCFPYKIERQQRDTHFLSLSLSHTHTHTHTHTNAAIIEGWIEMGCKMYVMSRYVGNITGWRDVCMYDDDDADVEDSRFHCLTR
jgi:hypothetical protein